MISAGKKIHTLVTNVPEALPPLREKKNQYIYTVGNRIEATTADFSQMLFNWFVSHPSPSLPKIKNKKNNGTCFQAVAAGTRTMNAVGLNSILNIPGFTHFFPLKGISCIKCDLQYCMIPWCVLFFGVLSKKFVSWTFASLNQRVERLSVHPFAFLEISK